MELGQVDHTHCFHWSNPKEEDESMELSSTDLGFDGAGIENVGDGLGGALAVREEEVQ